MKKILLIISICLIGVCLGLPSIYASEKNSRTLRENNNEYFSNCYLVASGDVTFTFQLSDIKIGLHRDLILYWPIIFNEPNVDVTILDKKDGNILWQNNVDQDQWVLHLVGFRGMYNTDGSTLENLIVNLDGRAAFISINLEGN